MVSLRMWLSKNHDYHDSDHRQKALRGLIRVADRLEMKIIITKE
jgi:hypothetical protein